MVKGNPTRASSQQTTAGAWFTGPAEPALTPGEVHIWAVPLDQTESECQICLQILSEDERQRASRFLQQVHRHRFIAAHAALRGVLARYLDRPAASLKFRFGSNGKPELTADLDHTLYFNLAHSENLALIAVGTDPHIGVDVERVRWLNDFDELVTRFFSPREATVFHELENDSKPQAFFNLWTRKEAWLKATGEGIGYSLDRVEVTFLDGEEPKLLMLPPGHNGVREHWSLIGLAPAPDFTGALAVNATGVQLKCWALPFNHGLADRGLSSPQQSSNNEQATDLPQDPSIPGSPGAGTFEAASVTLQRSHALRSGIHAPMPQSALLGHPEQTLAEPSPYTIPSPALPIAIAGVRFDNVSIPQAIEAIMKMIASRKAHYLVTANVDFVVQAQTDLELRRIFFDAHLVLCDGTPLLWAAKWLGNPLPERVAGADIVPLLIRLAAERGYRLFFLGATAESLGHAMENLHRLFPKLKIAGSYSPPFRRLLEMDHEAIQRRVADAKADLLFVSLGCPKQEKWVAMNYRSLNVPVTIGVGATIDFLAGHIRRAPVWMQRGGLEWLYRLLQEPRRLYRRYSKDIAVFTRKLIGQFIHFRIRQAETIESRTASLSQSRIALENKETAADSLHSPPMEQPSGDYVDQTESCNPALETVPGFGHDSLKIAGRFDAKAARTLLPSFQHVLSARRDCFLDLSETIAIDSTGIAMLMSLQRDVRALGRRLVLLAPNPVVTASLKWMQLDPFFDIAAEIPLAERILQTRTEESLHTVIFEADRSPAALLWQGEITAANAARVWQETHPHILTLRSGGSADCPQRAADTRSFRSLTIDLSGVRFIDSSGLGLMIRARKAARQNSGKIIFSNPQPAVSSVIRLARLESWLFDAEAGGADDSRHVHSLSASLAGW